MARDAFSDWPPEVEDVASVGPDLQIDVDRLASMDLDLVLAAESVPGMQRVNEQVEQAGLRHLVLAPTSLEEIREDVHRVGNVLDVPQRGAALAEAMEDGVGRVQTVLEEVEPVDVYWEWWPTPPITPGGGGWMDEIIQQAGGHNVFGHCPLQSHEVDLGAVQEADPDVVGLCWQGTLHEVQSIERFASRDRDAWGNLRAVGQQRVHLLAEELYGRPGPRLVEGLRQLAACLHPDHTDRLPQAYAWLPDALKDRLSL